jgi:hypothetical protein
MGSGAAIPGYLWDAVGRLFQQVMMTNLWNRGEDDVSISG